MGKRGFLSFRQAKFENLQKTFITEFKTYFDMITPGYDTDILPETAKPAANQEMINTGEMASSFWTKFKLYHEVRS